ncbi:DUF2251 domain-containing protein [Collimonas sp.]|jgi:hypothetical protein|uniref:DUF2251 domain-containing protein n=1 Tax=Collimonas sp. TaxID=1963772 RepID=UPI002C8A03A9|nr:DUF2251 domain-containing protein [Collimonas sp.]HWX03051.1 DUF2251 domain-containing protein [Collimonas sp.]
MPIQITAEKTFQVGQPTVVESSAPEGLYVAIFEDDNATGYFYALDASHEVQPIQDALHIYNVANISDRDKPSTVKIGWSLDSQKAVLLINGYPHAVFDFSSKQGYCRTGFPASAHNATWGSQGHEWSEDAIELFA